MTTTYDTFEKQLIFLKDNTRVISLNEAISKVQNNEPFETNTVVITFDDGYRDNYEFAFPLLKKYDLTASIFLTTDPLDTGLPLWWDRIDGIIRWYWQNNEFSEIKNSPLGQFIGDLKITNHSQLSNLIVDKINLLEKQERHFFWEGFSLWQDESSIPKIESPMMTWQMVQEMADNNISFECHTKSHAFLDELDMNGLVDELLGGRDRINKMTGQDAAILACPRGRMISSEKMDFIKQEFKAVCTTEAGFIDMNSDIYALNRMDAGYLALNGHFYRSHFAAELNGSWDKIRSIKYKLFH